MIALSRKMLEQEPTEMELLLPWHAAGTLNAHDTRRIDEALAQYPELARQYAIVREEYAETIGLNESLGAPSVRAMQKLFAAIDAEPTPRLGAVLGLRSRILGFLGSPSPRTLAWSAGLGALLLLLQAGVIGAVLIENQAATYHTTASLSMNEPLTSELSTAAAPRALVRFAPDARIADITALLDKYQALIIDGDQGGMFRLQFGDRAMSKDDVESLMNRLKSEKIVSLAVPTP